MINFAEKAFKYYDPMSSSYSLTVRVLAQKIALHLPAITGRYRVDPYVTDFGVQLDSYNCGIYVLLAFETFSSEDSIGEQRKKTLKYQRYRYLQICL
ncbi:hypothetical protein F444_22373 [Phytophthora nicotianae P1976]|uniref:Ubiquitin-like protease family profile domain-containing protein n=1 Tax=Phytophthora nicotianae P1976 TaxID=1317066 RepID=A0A080YXZ6_PHYNI|nr:hypothetical protein F444_22373 [Phytophthora nicotianae P1976]